MTFTIRDAEPRDAEGACEILKRSIAELCEADHRNDPIILGHWLSNKTPDIIRSWIEQTGNSVLLACDADAIVAVGSVTDLGEITLNYVSPDARFRGISKALLAALEARAAARGNSRFKLTSTKTAHRFYLSAGYMDDGPPRGKLGATSSYPMIKSLRTADR
jgi:GNAT superfamily N-acetyltransferase